MTDIHSKETRSYNMSRIRGKDTKPELLVRRFLHAHGFRYRIHLKDLPGKPDIVLRKYKTVIFVHGCFWHGHHNCKYAAIPETRSEWWKAKINGNIIRDNKDSKFLKEQGWNVIILWTCDLMKSTRNKKLLSLIEELLTLR
ncbi:very short patch repair endonuclease [Pedobacter nyackensis]|uniref:Very short patch repair endonuclease n=1 Tax=Pedobacter nyackensis TaxID=475255 RepID=A0A1W2EF25_9SPHI|nr:DNA mismatch endonuclease Vsr [Pedobacter nyackensis]SMD08354.1 T/G mismatch-specific endonuclease [Pedobacter nyackensis]